jgi:arylsulfatase A-like enzyme
MSAAARLLLVFLAFPGAFLPLDLLYAAPGIMTYATPDQAARIFLYSVALALGLSAIACAICLAARSVFFARWLALSLVAFALLYGLIRWSSFFIEYSDELQWLRQLLAFVLSVPAGFYLARRLRQAHLDTLRSVLRASTVAMALGALAFIALLALYPGPRFPGPTAVEAKGGTPAIFLITIDALSALRLPTYGYQRPTAPRLAEFAAGASVFLRHYASSNFTTSTVTSMLYGTRPWTDRAIQHEGRPLARLSAQSLPALLKAGGYFTASVSTNPWAAPRTLGLEEYFDVLSENNVCAANDPLWVLRPDLQVALKSSLAWSGLLAIFVRAADALGTCPGTHFDPELAFAQARRILAQAPADRPLFLWVHVFPPHDPYVTPAPFLGLFAPLAEARDRASTIPPYLYAAGERFDFPGLWGLRYDEAIRYVDHHVGGFLDELKRVGRFNQSLIVVTADHGESFSKGYGGHGGPGLHEDLVHIPLLVKAPGQGKGARIAELSEQVDLAPTILELAGVRRPQGGEGVSLAPALRGAALDRPVFAMNFQQSRRLGALETGIVAMLQGRWKYVHYFGHIYYPRMPQLEDALYDLALDPGETWNQIPLRARLAGEMRAAIEAQLRQHGRPIE